jgi:hypothetical protein
VHIFVSHATLQNAAVLARLEAMSAGTGITLRVHALSHTADGRSELVARLVAARIDAVPLERKVQVYEPAMAAISETKIVLAGEKQDFLVAHHTFTPLLYIAGGDVAADADVRKYGLGVPADKLKEAVLALHNAKHVFYESHFTSPGGTPVEVYAIIRANSFRRSTPTGERETVTNVTNYLKRRNGGGHATTMDAIRLHLLGVVAHRGFLRDVQDWGYFPSSRSPSAAEPEPSGMMEEFKEFLRYYGHGRKPAPIFLRTATIPSSHSGDGGRNPARQFPSLQLNPVYAGKLKKRTVCIVDDFITSGGSFEAARALLEREGAAKVCWGYFYVPRRVRARGVIAVLCLDALSAADKLLPARATTALQIVFLAIGKFMPVQYQLHSVTLTQQPDGSLTAAAVATTVATFQEDGRARKEVMRMGRLMGIADGELADV